MSNSFRITRFAPLIEAAPNVNERCRAGCANLKYRDFFWRFEIENNVKPAALFALQFSDKNRTVSGLYEIARQPQPQDFAAFNDSCIYRIELRRIVRGHVLLGVL